MLFRLINVFHVINFIVVPGTQIFNRYFYSPKVFKFYVHSKCQPMNLHTGKANVAVLLNIHLFLPGQNSYIFQLLRKHVSKACIIGYEVTGTGK